MISADIFWVCLNIGDPQKAGFVHTEETCFWKETWILAVGYIKHWDAIWFPLGFTTVLVSAEFSLAAKKGDPYFERHSMGLCLRPVLFSS